MAHIQVLHQSPGALTHSVLPQDLVQTTPTTLTFSGWIQTEVVIPSPGLPSM